MPLFRRSLPELKDLAAIGVDLHNHVLAGLDDGSPSLEESLRMLRLWVELGYRKVITTPHVISALYPNTSERILGQMYHLQEVIREEGIPIELEATAEYHLDYEFGSRLESGEVIGFGKRNYLLLELPFQSPGFKVEEVFYQVQLAGYEPVLAHPERYSYLSENFKSYEYLKDRDIAFQLNLLSLTGNYGPRPLLAARRLIDAGMIDFAGSDAHHAAHLTDLRKMLRNRHLQKLIASGRLRNNEL